MILVYSRIRVQIIEES